MSDDEMIRTLAALTPARSTDATDATAIAFEAGRRSARSSIVRWRAATTVAFAAALAALPLRTRSDRPTLVATAPPPSTTIETTPPAIVPLQTPIVAPPPDNVIALRDAVLANGLDGLPPLPHVPAARPTSIRDLIGGDL